MLIVMSNDCFVSKFTFISTELSQVLPKYTETITSY